MHGLCPRSLDPAAADIRGTSTDNNK